MGGNLILLGPREGAPRMQGMQREREGLPSALMREKQPASWLPSVGGCRTFVGNPWLLSSPSVHGFLEFSMRWPLADPTHHGQGQGPLSPTLGLHLWKVLDAS